MLVPQSVPWLRFPSPLIKPDMRNYRIRLSDWIHLKAHAGQQVLSVKKTDGCLANAPCAVQLRLRVKLSPKISNLLGGCRPRPLTWSRLLQKRSRSKGPFLHRSYPVSTVLFPSPTPARASTRSTVTGCDPAPGTGLPRYSSYLPDMPSSLPR